MVVNIYCRAGMSRSSNIKDPVNEKEIIMIKPPPFADLLRKFRLDRDLYKVDLAEAIQKSDGYIRKLELGYTPPTFPICQKLAETLSLTEDEKKQFIAAAFFGRIKPDLIFYDALHQENGTPTFQASSFAVPAGVYEKDEVVYKCTYLISWKTKSEKSILADEPVRDALQKLIEETISELTYALYHLQVSGTEITMVLDIDPKSSVHEFTKGLKSLSSSFLRNQFPNISAQITGSVWSNRYTVLTLDSNKEVSTHVSELVLTGEHS